ncbi:uncharacterized protein LOC143182555 [Calliopsis andreniformis]|uniref:uncharacterized protein LOC143182555 n=1 Tax=Calliopsis andreniformis TaxID=337506 RepID=UPI003FCEB9AA
MKNAHPIITAATSSLVSPDSSSPNEPTEPIIRLKLDKPLHWEWELTTSADTLPVIQLLDKDGRLLVETTGKTAQRARGSFRDGLKSYEEFPPGKSKTPTVSSSFTSSSASSSTVPAALQGNRNIDGFSTKFGGCEFGYKPRKSRSEVTVKEREKRSRKRHSVGPESSTKQNEEAKSALKGYSAGDYLRQQIIDDLRTRSTVGKSPEEVAKERCKKVKAYLRSQSEVLPRLVHVEEEEGEKTESTVNGDEIRIEKITDGLNRLRKAIEKGETRVSDDDREARDAVSRNDSAVLSEMDGNSRQRDRESRNRIENKELEKVKAFLQRKLQQKMQQERSRSSSRCDFQEQSSFGIKKGYSDYWHNKDPSGYRTRKVRSETNIIRFDPEVLQKEKKRGKQPERERSRSRISHSEDSMKQKACHRSRSDAILEASESREENRRARVQTRESSGSEKRKLYRKTRSDVLLGQTGGSLDSEQENPPRRIRSEDNVDESWWEYKERKKHERLHRETEKEVTEEDFMSKPRWKDLQAELCSFRNCKICQNLQNCVNPLQKQEENAESCGVPEEPSKDTSNVTSNESTTDRPATRLQENYLAVDRSSDDPKSLLVAKVRVKNHEMDTSNVNSGDCGYNTIPKKAFNDYRELYMRSNVKKSDTFKIVDGSEDPEEAATSELKGECDEGSVDSFGCSNGEGLLTNKSNEDIARDYFKRVYELLKKRQEEARRNQERQGIFGCEDSSSSNYAEKVQKKRLRRKKKDRNGQGEEVVTVPPTSGGQDSWKVQTLSLASESPSNRRRGCRPQLQAAPAGKRTRPAPPPPSLSSKVNAKDINKYFDWPNKENTPGNAVNESEGTNEPRADNEQPTMGSNLSRHNGKGLTGRRTQSSGNLCDPKGKLNSMGKILVPCSSAQRERYKFCGSLPNHLDDKDVMDDDPKDNNNIMTDTITGNLGGTLPHKKRSLGVHFSDTGPTGTLDLVKHRSQDSLDENDPWRYQQSDLDLVRCRHGNFDSVRRNRSVDAVSGDSSRRYGRGVSLEDRCHRNSDLDLVGTLPKRKQEGRNSGKAPETNSSSQSCIPDATDDDLLMQIVHKPDCELVRHRQQLSKCIDLKLSKLVGGEPQDQGYASERSPEDEHPPSLPGQPFPNITPESTFRVTLQKSSRGLGLSVSGGGTAGPVRVKRLFPQQPAALCNKLQPGDILLAANGVPLTGLTNYEALEVLRTTPSTVELVVCRLPGDTNVTPPGAPPPPPARREPPPPLRILNPLPPLQIEPCGEFDIEMTKVGGSLGFTLRKADSSALGHYVRALVREPALSDGRIRPGDKIVAVDGAPLSPMSHEEAVQLLRQCGPTVRLRLYRDLAQTPVSALSPTEPDHPLRPPRTSLRQEAVDMLCDLAVRKLSPGTSSGSSCKQSPGASCNSPRRLRRLATRTPTAENEQDALEKHSSVQTTSTASQAETSDSDQCSIRTQITNSQPNTPGTDIIDPPPLYDVCDSSDSSSMHPSRPSFLDLSAPQGKPHFQFCSLDSDPEYPEGGDGIVDEGERNGASEADYQRRGANGLSSDEHDNGLPSEPASMPPVLSASGSSSAAFSYKNPAYQSANPACGVSIDPVAKNKTTHSSDQDIPGKILGADDPAGSKGLLKWKGVMFAPDDGIDKNENEEKVGKDTTDSAVPDEELEQGTEVFMVELTRGWNSRLGFSLQPEGNHTVISVVHPDSVAAKDGRLKQGDVLLMVNDESVKDMSTADIIDLLRKIRGSIGITVMRRTKRENVT